MDTASNHPLLPDSSWKEITADMNEEEVLQRMIQQAPLEYAAFHGDARESIVRIVLESPHLRVFYVLPDAPTPWHKLLPRDQIDPEDGPCYKSCEPSWFLGKVVLMEPYSAIEGFHEFGDLYIANKSGIFCGDDEGPRIQRMCPGLVLIAGTARLLSRPEGYDWVHGKGWTAGRRNIPEPGQQRAFRKLWREMSKH